MKESYCATGRVVCPHLPQCVWECCHDLTTETRKIKPYPVVPEDVEPVDEQWQKVGTFMLSVAMLILVVFFVTTFMMGVWLWGVLV